MVYGAERWHLCRQSCFELFFCLALSPPYPWQRTLAVLRMGEQKRHFFHKVVGESLWRYRWEEQALYCRMFLIKQISLRKEHIWKLRILKVTPNYLCHRPLEVFTNPQGTWIPDKRTALMKLALVHLQTFGKLFYPASTLPHPNSQPKNHHFHRSNFCLSLWLRFMQYLPEMPP